MTEPALTPDELVAVRGLIQERYQDPSSTIVQSAPTPSVGGEGPAGSTHSPESPAGHPNLTLPDPAEMPIWPLWLVLIHAANCLEWPTHSDLVDELRKRSDRINPQKL